ncbi:DUF1501 domain-containing protein [Bowmanella denitrificans]|uniref:DUF1501 domain-containing protein n=1 Tax=Bowmanella denitrificans TaxID=366582 RepID=A0ABN0WXZ4_9ALTE
MKTQNHRRQFIKSMAKGLAGTVLGSSLLPLFANAQSSAGYKALVCINLQGGNDAFNCFVPMGTSAYNSYAAIRQELAISREQLLPLNSGQQPYGLHNHLLETQSLFNRGKLAVLANTGNLREPISKQAYFDKTALPPAQLFSHHDQTLYAHTLNQGTLSSGWAGRVAELLAQSNINQQLAMNVSLSGDNYLQRGINRLPYTVRSSGVSMIDQLSEADPTAFSASRARLYRQFLSSTRPNLLQNYYADVQMDAWGMAQYVTDILDSQPMPSLPIFAAANTNSFVQSLAMIVRLIAAQDAFEVKRQVFYVNLGGFDTHRDQLTLHSPLLMQLDQGLGLFYQALEALGLENNVTAFTMSEFGRTLTRNGDGTDHGWGSHHFILGGAVKGGQIYGQLPTLELDSDDDVGRGRIIPTTSFEQYVASLCRWFGVAKDDLNHLLPNLRNFNHPDLGFLG